MESQIAWTNVETNLGHSNENLHIDIDMVFSESIFIKPDLSQRILPQYQSAL